MQDEYDTITVRGTLRFRKNKKMVAKSSLPREVMERFGLMADPKAREDNPATRKACIFCGMHSRLTRYINGQTVYLCDGDYYDTNMGKIAQRLRELENGKEKTVQTSQENDGLEGQEAVLDTRS